MDTRKKMLGSRLLAGLLSLVLVVGMLPAAGAKENLIEDIICQKENKLELIKNIQKLDIETQKVMYLRIYAELSYEEIAEVLGKTASWSRIMFFRGKEKIKENLKKENKNEKRM